MSQLHRQLDHDFIIWSRQLNYSLFGNEAGRTVAKRKQYWPEIEQAVRKARSRASRWYMLWAVEDVRHKCKLPEFNARLRDEAWLRYKEIEV